MPLMPITSADQTDQTDQTGHSDQPSPTEQPKALPGNRAVDDRLTQLEIKASFTEDLLEQLDQVIVRQQQHIDQLIRAVADLGQRNGDAHAAGNQRSLRDDLPPHF